MDTRELLKGLGDGSLDARLGRIYGSGEELARARDRAGRTARRLEELYGPHGECGLFSGPGRTEIGGNHTDHQHGRVLCGSVNLDILAAAAPNGTWTARVASEGYEPIEVDLSDLEPREEEFGTTAGLVRGVAAGAVRRGYKVGGFDAAAVSSVLSGSGLSSSAAFEVLVGNIVNAFFCGGSMDPVEIAKIGQFAENVYFGKPCGLMDQMGSSVGGAVGIDFSDLENPVITPVDFDFSGSGHALCIIDTRSDHADLTGDYAAITQEMRAVAGHFGKGFLREVPEAEFRAAVPELRRECGDRAVIRAMHFYADDARAAMEAEALKNRDFEGFLRLVNESGLSSETLLQNIWSPSDPQRQAVTLALAAGKALLGGRGAIRVHGGGFAGTVQAFVPEELVSSFRAGIDGIFGAGACHILRIRPTGGAAII